MIPGQSFKCRIVSSKDVRPLTSRTVKVHNDWHKFLLSTTNQCGQCTLYTVDNAGSKILERTEITSRWERHICTVTTKLHGHSDAVVILWRLRFPISV
jgi:hypothetical protein